MKIRNILGAVLVAVSSLAIVSPTYAVDCPEGTIRQQKGIAANTLAECNVEPDSSLMPTVTTIINLIIGVLGIAAVAVVVLGGVQYVTSTGDPGKTKKAKDTILYGIIGLIVAALAFAIVNFVLSSIFGSSTTGAGGGGGTPAVSPTPNVN